MKKIILFVFICIAGQSYSQSGAFMAETAKLNAAKTAEQVAAVRPGLEKNMTTDWQSQYYVAYSYLKEADLLARNNDFSKMSSLTAAADQILAKLDGQAAKNSEIRALKAYSAIVKMSADPVKLSDTEGKKAHALLYLKENIDDSNPRFHLLRAELEYLKLKDKNSDKNLKYLFQNAVSKFKAFKPESASAPTWGQQDAEYYISIIK